jgi:hypothetical protein
MTAREALLQEILDEELMSTVRGGSWIDTLRDWYYRYGPKCGSVGLNGIGTVAWMGKMTAYAIAHSTPAPPPNTCSWCTC